MAEDKKGTNLKSSIIKQVINYCNRDIVPDSKFADLNIYPSEWFVQYFSFLEDSNVEKYLGDAFYQARFTYKLMTALKLPLSKHKAIVCFQIIQYASICEALLQTVISKYFKTQFEKKYAIIEYKKCPTAVSKVTKIMYEGEEVFLCKQIEKKADIKRERNDNKTAFAVEHGIITLETKEKIDGLYTLRNNVHILKAAEKNYNPRLYESKEAFLLMQRVTEEIKEFYKNNPLN